MSDPKDKSFKRLQEQWYRKLKRAGFEDIEDTTDPKRLLKVWHSSYFRLKYSPVYFESKRVYFEWCEEFLAIYRFDRPDERKIWELHTGGYSLREIARRLGFKKSKVEAAVNRLRLEMRANRKGYA